MIESVLKDEADGVERGDGDDGAKKNLFRCQRNNITRNRTTDVRRPQTP